MYSKAKGHLKWDQRPQSGPSVCNVAKTREVAHHCVERPISGIFGEFTQKLLLNFYIRKLDINLSIKYLREK